MARRAHDLDLREPLEDLLPDDLKLQLGQLEPGLGVRRTLSHGTLERGQAALEERLGDGDFVGQSPAARAPGEPVSRGPYTSVSQLAMVITWPLANSSV